MSTVRRSPPFSIHLSIPWVPKSLNKELRTHFRGRHKANLEWDSYVWAETRGLTPAKPLAKAKLRIERHSHRMLDFDGLVGSLKPVVDALVYAGILSDDSWTVLGKWEVDQIFRPKKSDPLLEIFIEEILS